MSITQQTFTIKTGSSANVGDEYRIFLNIEQPHYSYGYGYGQQAAFTLSPTDNPYDKTYPTNLNYFNIFNLSGYNLGFGINNTKSAVPYVSLSPDFFLAGVEYPEEANGNYFTVGIFSDPVGYDNFTPEDYKIHENGEFVLFKYTDISLVAHYVIVKYDSLFSSGDISNRFECSTWSGTYVAYGDWRGHRSWGGAVGSLTSYPTNNFYYGWGYGVTPTIYGDLSETITIKATVLKNGSAANGKKVMFYGSNGLIFSSSDGVTDANGEVLVTVQIDASKQLNLDFKGGDPDFIDRFSFGYMEVTAAIEEAPYYNDSVVSIKTITDQMFGITTIDTAYISTYSYGYGYGV